MSEIEKMIFERMIKDSIEFTKNQEKAYSYMVNRKNIFITGPAGVGKTSVIKSFMKNYETSREIAVTSTTGTSALLINGTTIHSYLGIGYGNQSIELLVKKICGRNWLYKRWISLECLLIDEISMLDPELFDKIEEIARVVRKNEKPFGGIQLVLSGDFLQLPCVGNNSFCFESKSWDRCIDETIYLNKIIRQGNKTFQNVLNSIREGKITEDVKKVLDSRIGVKLNNDYGIKPTRLYPKNYDVDVLNNKELDILAEDGKEFYEYEMEVDLQRYYTMNKNIIKEKFYKNCTAPKILQLCIGTQVMLLKNLDLQNGLANGSRGVVTGFVGDIPVVKFLNGVERVIDYDIWEVSENDKKILRATQIPLKVAYAISIHKSQGCSLDYAEIDLSSIFEYGQAYVALSRVKSLGGLNIIDIDYDFIKSHPKALEYYNSLYS